MPGPLETLIFGYRTIRRGLVEFSARSNLLFDPDHFDVSDDEATKATRVRVASGAGGTVETQDDIDKSVPTKIDTVKGILGKAIRGTRGATPMIGASTVYNPNAPGGAGYELKKPVRPGEHDVTNYGLVGDGITDNTVAFQAFIDTIDVAGKGVGVHFPPGDFYFADDVHITRPIDTNRGAGCMTSTVVGPIGKITMAAGKGWIVHTAGQGYAPACTAEYSRIRGLYFRSTLLTLASWVASTAKVAGNRIRASNKNRYYYECIKAGTTSAGSEPDFRAAYNIDTTTLRPASARVELGCVVRDLAASTTVFWECTTAGTTGAGTPSWSTTPGLTTVDGSAVWTCRTASGTWLTDGTVVWSTRQHSGLWLRGRAIVEDCYFEAFTNSGVSLLNTVTPYVNNNLCNIARVRTYGCGVGIAIRGFDSSQHEISHCDIENTGLGQPGTGGVGIWDGGFTGSQIYSCHVSNCSGQSFVLGRYDLEAGTENGRTGSLFGCYTEGGLPSIVVGPGGVVIGGNYGGGISSDSNPTGIAVPGAINRNLIEIDDTFAKNPFGYVNWRGRGLVHAFGSDDEPFYYQGTLYEAPQLGRDGWWSDVVHQQATIRARSGAKASEGYGWGWTPIGEFKGGHSAGGFTGQFFKGYDDTSLRVNRVRRVGRYEAGDRFELQCDGQPGSFTGIIVSVAGYRGRTWSASLSVTAAVGDYQLASTIEPTTNDATAISGLPMPGQQVWKCTTSGTTGLTEPSWPGSPTPGVTTVADGTAVFTYLGTVPEYQRYGVIGDVASADCAEPAATHQVETEWSDAACTEAPGAPRIDVYSGRNDSIAFNDAGGTPHTVYTIATPESALSGTRDLYRLDVSLLLGHDASTAAYVSATGHAVFTVDDTGTAALVGTSGVFHDDASSIELTFDVSTSTVLVQLDVDPGPLVGVNVVGGIVWQMQRFKSITTTGGGG